MSVKPYVFDGGLLTGAAVVQGTVVPALTTRVIKAASLVNTTGAPVAATVNLTPAGTVAASNTLISARSIAAGESYPCPELINQGIIAGGSVMALGAGLTFKYTAVDFT